MTKDDETFPVKLSLKMDIKGVLLEPGMADATFVQPGMILVPVDEKESSEFFVMAASQADSAGWFRCLEFSMKTGAPCPDNDSHHVSRFVPLIGRLTFFQEIEEVEEGAA